MSESPFIGQTKGGWVCDTIAHAILGAIFIDVIFSVNSQNCVCLHIKLNRTAASAETAICLPNFENTENRRNGGGTAATADKLPFHLNLTLQICFVLFNPKNVKCQMQD